MRNRRGLSTVVGAVFFVIAATTVISYISYSMNSIDQFSQSVIVAEAENINRGMEKISITQITIDGGEFNMTVVNTGSLPVHLTRLWVTDEDSTASDKKADLDVRINPGKEVIKIGIGTGILADSSVSYTLKAVTERGNIATFQISPDVSTDVRLIVPGSVLELEPMTITLLISNNSTSPNNIADLEPMLYSNIPLTQIGSNQSNVQALKTGETASFTWQYTAPSTQILSFTGTYVGAPSGTSDTALTSVFKFTNAEAAAQAEWSEKARKVGILISGIPSPINDKSSGGGIAKFGIGIINPLDRPVEIYAIAINSIAANIFRGSDAGQIEPTTGWDNAEKDGHSVIYWQNATVDGAPRIVLAESVSQFRTTFDVTAQGADLLEIPLTIEALSSEGKLSVTYNISLGGDYPTINAYYTKDPLSPATPDDNWGYQIMGIKSATSTIFNATIENTSSSTFTGNAKIALTILLPSDFTYETVCTECVNTAWTEIVIITNPDESVFIKARSVSSLGANDHITFQFKATAPTVIEKSLYVFTTTTYYPGWDKPIIASSLSEAGVEVIP